MEPSDRIISESQERMLLVVNPDFVQKVFDIFEKWDLEYSLVGVVNYSGKYNIIDNNENVLYEEDITNFTDIVEHWPENRVENNFPIIEKVKNNKAKTLAQEQSIESQLGVEDESDPCSKTNISISTSVNIVNKNKSGMIDNSFDLDI